MLSISSRWVNHFRIIAAVAVIYCLLDLPLRLSGAFSFPDAVGVKSFLPFSIGLFFGPAGAAGCALGAVLSGLLAGAPLNVIVSESIIVIICGVVTWYLWFVMNKDGNVRLERARDILTMGAIVLAVSLVSGLTAYFIIGRSMFVPMFTGYLISGMLISTVVNILLGGIFCVQPVCPSFCIVVPDVIINLAPDVPHTDSVNEQVEEIAFAKKIPMKRVFEIESCLEELYIRIRRKLPEVTVKGSVDLGTTISLRLWIDGEAYNPLHMGKEEDEMDVLSLKLIRHRALRSSYEYKDSENRIHIVV